MVRELLAKLTGAHGVPGMEDEVREVITSEIKNYVDELFVDKLGNLIAKKRASANKPTLMFAAHMDEIGLVVKHLEDNGFIRFARIGGVPEHILPGRRVFIHTRKGKIPGVIGIKPPHLMKEDERKKLLEADSLFIDIGANSKEELTQYGVDIGTPITFDEKLCELTGDYVSGKAFDDRAGCCVLIEVLKRSEDHEVNICAAFTAQEEVGLKGATVSAYRLNPDLAIAIDVTSAGDNPYVKEYEAPVKTRRGPVITIADGRRDGLGGGIIVSPIVRNLLIEAAKRDKIPVQFEVIEGGTTDATAIQLSREGILSGVLSIPVRYIHTPVEVLSLKDLESAIALCLSLVRGFRK